MYIASPDPGVYNLISDFDIGKPGTANIGTKRGIYSMGKKVKNPDDPMSKLDKYDGMPGPGAYTSKLMTIGHSGPMYNLQGRSHNVNGKFSIIFVLILSSFSRSYQSGHQEKQPTTWILWSRN